MTLTEWRGFCALMVMGGAVIVIIYSRRILWALKNDMTPTEGRRSGGYSRTEHPFIFWNYVVVTGILGVLFGLLPVILFALIGVGIIATAGLSN